METILYVTAEAVRQVAILAQPVTPTGASRLLDLLGQGPDRRSFRSLGEAGRLEPGTSIPPPTGVFPRYLEPGAELPKTSKEGKRKMPPEQG
jgi:methionyl-tRNA synthetase